MTIKDLSLINQQPLTLKFGEDMTFTIPSDPSLEFTYKLMEFEDKMKASNSSKEQFDLLIDMVVEILKQDKTKKVDKNFVKKNLHLSQIKGVVQIYQEQIVENQNNPN